METPAATSTTVWPPTSASALATWTPASPPASTPAPAATNQEWPIYTTAEVATHKNPKDLWIIISGSVYDVTEFHKIHRGGRQESILKFGGKTATRAFRNVHSRMIEGPACFEQLETYKIGTVAKKDWTFGLRGLFGGRKES